MTPPDTDGDGVPDSLDVEVISPPHSVGFSDASPPALGSGTYGVITPNGLELSVEDVDPSASSTAARISAEVGTGSMLVSACDENLVWSLSAGDSVLVDCVSVTLTVEQGDGVSGKAANSTIGLTVGTTATFDLAGDSLAVSEISGGSVTVGVDLPGDDAQLALPEGTAGTFDTTSATLSGASGDGVTVTLGGVTVPVSAGGLTMIQRGSGNDLINGTSGDDLIIDAGGNNTIKGNSGNDTIVTGSGNDTIDGGGGDDRIDAGGGNNIVKGGAGDDSLTAGSGNDTIDGGEGYDVCNPGLGANKVKDCEG